MRSRCRAATWLAIIALACFLQPAKSRTCLSTRKNTRPSCSPRCKLERASLHCRACVCVACAFCNLPGTETADSGAQQSVGLHSVQIGMRASSGEPSTPVQTVARRPSHWRKTHRSAKAAPTALATESTSRLGRARRWAPTSGLFDFQANQTLASIVLRALGYVPGSQLPLEFGGPHVDYTVVGASAKVMSKLLGFEDDAAGPTPLSLREQRLRARRAARKGRKIPAVDWHASPVAGLLPQSRARPATPKARVKKRKKNQPGTIDVDGELVASQNLTLVTERAPSDSSGLATTKVKSHAKKAKKLKSKRHAPMRKATQGTNNKRSVEVREAPPGSAGASHGDAVYHVFMPHAQHNASRVHKHTKVIRKRRRKHTPRGAALPTIGLSDRSPRQRRQGGTPRKSAVTDVLSDDASRSRSRQVQAAGSSHSTKRRRHPRTHPHSATGSDGHSHDSTDVRETDAVQSERVGSKQSSGRPDNLSRMKAKRKKRKVPEVKGQKQRSRHSFGNLNSGQAPRDTTSKRSANAGAAEVQEVPQRADYHELQSSQSVRLAQDPIRRARLRGVSRAMELDGGGVQHQSEARQASSPAKRPASKRRKKRKNLPAKRIKKGRSRPEIFKTAKLRLHAASSASTAQATQAHEDDDSD